MQLFQALASRRPRGSWPWMLLATFAVAILPLLVVTAIQLTGVLRSTLSSVVAAAALSIGASVAGSALWTRRRGSRDVVFADLMIWGWLRRCRTERRLASASALLGERASLTPGRQAELLERLSAALEARDPYTHGHSRRVTRYSEAIARGMGLAREEVAKIRTAAAVHDVGKMRTPRDVLNKPGRLTDEDFAAIKLHPVDGAELVAGMGDPELTAMVRHHHERLDGRGYPDRLEGADIPLGARIIAVADTFDAITSTRPYRPGAQHKTALDILRKEAGGQLDPDAVSAFLRYYSGRRSVAWWSVFAGEPPRFMAWLLGWLQGTGAAPIAKGVVAAGAMALVGGAVAGPIAPAAAVRSPGVVAATAARGPANSAGSVQTATSTPSGRRADADRGRSGDGTRRHRKAPSRRRSHSPAKRRVDSRSTGGRSAPASADSREAGSRDDGGGGGAGNDDSGSGEGGSGGSSGTGGGGSGPGGGSGTGTGGSSTDTGGSDPGPVPIVDAIELPALPVDVPLPKVETPPLAPLPDVPDVELPPVESPVDIPPLLGGG